MGMRRFTISVAPDMKIALEGLKKERYGEETRNEMIRDLITRGLNVLKVESKAKNCGRRGTLD